jgi:hypothetical protein
MDFSELFGMQKPEEPDEASAIALLMRFLADMLSKRDENHVQRETEKTNEIPVRPRIEPLGGS